MGTLYLNFDFNEKWAPNPPKVDKVDFMFSFNFIKKWASNRPKADKEDFTFFLFNWERGIFYLQFDFIKNEPQMFYVFYFIFFKNEPKIGLRRIKKILCFLFDYFEKWAQNRPKADEGHFMFLFIFVEKLTPNRPKADKRDIIFIF